MEVKNLLLRFSGNKAELKKQLEDWCEKSKQKSQNDYVINLIEKDLKKNNK